MSKEGFAGPLERIDETTWRIPPDYKPGMQVEGRIYADERLIEQIRKDQAPEQVANVATLPGIQVASLAMPDIHWGYGFCIGGVAATDPEEGGVISPGGVGYDINCGVRLMRTNLHIDDVRPRLSELMNVLFQRIPAGVGKGGPYLFSGKQMDQLLEEGCRYLKKIGLATEEDLKNTEEGGCMAGADASCVSNEAKKRGSDQCGTLGAGNHFLEVQVVEEIFDPEAARIMGLEPGTICVMIHSGSRGLGYQVCDDALQEMRRCPEKYHIQLPDRQLACAPINSPEGQRYLAGMRAAANYAWANRQLLMWQTREAFSEFFGKPWEELGMDLVYDVAHNIAKMEKHIVDGKEKLVCVHRKGATRAFPPGHPDVPERYRAIGQPVIIPGDMGRESWVLVGQPASMEKTFGTTCHGAGRVLSRNAAIQVARGRQIDKELAAKGIIARAHSRAGLAEEHSDAYKDVSIVVDIVDRAGLAKKVARLRPVGVVKG
ncbi:Protein RtcB [Thermogutta terrifontis]|uniref:tRNA-splicing ligase RtcB n=1 Tax=Thermogutta terrifontis TaxID=1331910 RepID=A0A286RM75_9BACT|nr:RtcB family protein [Thermogutta terrifontis]ASV77062.1 Protein RtcB [Thermogutta terrifontis]